MKTLYSANLSGFECDGKAISFVHGDVNVSVKLIDILSIRLESDMSAKSGAYVKLTLDTEDITLIVDSECGEFFELLFEILCVELDVSMEEVFNVSVANTKTEKVVFQK